jgi:hypothetical protein
MDEIMEEPQRVIILVIIVVHVGASKRPWPLAIIGHVVPT